MKACECVKDEQINDTIELESNSVDANCSIPKVFMLEMDDLSSPRPSFVTECNSCSCSQIHPKASKSDQIELIHNPAIPFSSSSYSAHSSSQFLNAPDCSLTHQDNGYFNYLPFALVSIILAITLMFLVSASIVYFQCKSFFLILIFIFKIDYLTKKIDYFFCSFFELFDQILSSKSESQKLFFISLTLY